MPVENTAPLPLGGDAPVRLGGVLLALTCTLTGIPINSSNKLVSQGCLSAITLAVRLDYYVFSCKGAHVSILT